MKQVFGSISATLLSILLLTQGVSASSIYATGTLGIDVSYPNCSTKLPAASLGIVGVTAGLVYSHNACLAAEAAHFSDLSFYMNTGLNDSSTSPYYTQALATCNGDVFCAAYQYGYSAAQDAFAYASSQGVTSAKWWLDVETANTWSGDVAQNQRSLQGMYDALSGAGATTIGVYSTTAQWQSVTAGWYNNWPSWGATTWTTAKQAETYCTGHQFTGGPSLLMQYKSKQSRVDRDVAC